jgi:hypothetical protein
MPTFKYTGDDRREWPPIEGTMILGWLDPGDTIEADTNPDAMRFEEVGASGEAVPPSEPEPEPAVEPAAPQEG